MDDPLFIAVDLGAGSGRAFLAGIGSGEFLLEEIHRFHYPPIEKDGHPRWDLGHIFTEIKFGLKAAGVRAKQLGREILSLGIDSWAVDYGLLDLGGNLIANPVCYRDDRTNGAMERIFELVPRSEIFEKTGIQFQPFNTLFQLASETVDLGKVSKLLLLPDLINYFLTGNVLAEYTNATTTQLVNSATRDWDHDLLERVGIPAGILPEIVSAGTTIGYLTSGVRGELDFPEISVIAPATHDTGSAIAGAPLLTNQAYISSGTWSLIGIETGAAIINDDAAHQNFTNEGGVYGTNRFLKNVMGLWIFESCRREWKSAGIETQYDELLSQVAAKSQFEAFIFPDDPRFLNPTSMLDAVAEQLIETGQKFERDAASISKIIFDSLAFRYASVVRSIERLTSKKLGGIQILGGGGRNLYLNQMAANASDLNVEAGLTEATVVGNVLVQAITAGKFDSLEQARSYVRKSFELETFEPRPTAEIDEARARYASIETIFVG